MGNNMGAGTSKAAKVMKINGESFKLKTPSKVSDVIKDYPDHILLDSEEFLRFNLRAKPLNLEDELKPRKIYLLVDLPKFPDNNNFNGVNNTQSPLRKVRSGVLKPTVTRDLMMKKATSRRSVSDDLTIMMKSTASMSSFDDGGISGSLCNSHVGPTRVKMRLPKAQVQRIMEESGDDVEVAKKIVRLCLEENATVSPSDTVADEEEEEEKESGGNGQVVRHCLNVHGLSSSSPWSSYRRKYQKLTP